MNERGEIWIPLDMLWRGARKRDKGFLDAVMDKSRLQGGSLKLKSEDWDALLKQFPEVKTIRGLGDLVHVILKPVAAASDFLFKTDLQNCRGCDDRRDALNKQLPL